MFVKPVESVARVKYIALNFESLNDKDNVLPMWQKISNYIDKELSENYGWLKFKNKTTYVFYNNHINAIFPNLDNLYFNKNSLPVEYITNSHPLSSIDLINKNFLTVSELKQAFSTEHIAHIISYFGWYNFRNVYFVASENRTYENVYKLGEHDKDAIPWRRVYNIPADRHSACALLITPLPNKYRENKLQLLHRMIKEGYSLVLTRNPYENAQKEINHFLYDNLLSENTISLPRVINVTKDSKLVQKIRSYFLEADNKRSGIKQYPSYILDANNGNWDLWEFIKYNNYEETSLPKCENKIWYNTWDLNIWAKNPEKIVALNEYTSIDFGTYSTVVAKKYGDDNQILLQNISGLSNTENDFENPTILKFVNFQKFIDAYNSKEYRPETKFNDITTSYSAYNDFTNIDSDDNPNYYLNHLKQWILDPKINFNLIDGNYHQVELTHINQSNDTIDENGFNPIEIYAYYLGISIINMKNDAICLKYILSFPPTFSIAKRRHLKVSFERGITKAMPSSLVDSDIFRENFSVSIGVSEPVAYAICAIQEFCINPKNTSILCCVFDFGGGTVDFSFGIYNESDPQKDYKQPYTYRLLETGGNPMMGCEFLIEKLAYDLLCKHEQQLAESDIKFARPYHCRKRMGTDGSNSRIAKINTLMIINRLREQWKKGKLSGENLKMENITLCSESNKPKAVILAFKGNSQQNTVDDTQDDLNNPIILNFEEDYLKKFFSSKLEEVIISFINQLDEIYNQQRQQQKKLQIKIFLGGNASKAQLVTDIFRRLLNSTDYANLPIVELLPPLGSSQSIERPTAKTAVAYGQLYVNDNLFAKVECDIEEVLFRYSIGLLEFDKTMFKRAFVLKYKASEFSSYDNDIKQLISKVYDKEVTFWFTDNPIVSINKVDLPENIGAKPCSITIPERLIGCMLGCRAVSETELQLTAYMLNNQNNCYDSYEDIKRIDLSKVK